jgi:hypothetical protein
MVAGAPGTGRSTEVPTGPAGLGDGTGRTRRFGPVAGALGVLGAAGALLYTVDPGGGPVLCPFRALTGLACPGCGTTRMLHHLLHGELATAFSYNPLTFLLLPVALWLVFGWLRTAFGGPRPALPRVPAAWGWVAVAGVGAYWVARNLPVAPFRALALPA